MGFKGPRNMTVLLPGMTEDDQRVKISSCDQTQQGLLDSWKTKVKHLFLFKLISIPLNSCAQLFFFPIRIWIMWLNYIIKHPYGMMIRSHMC